MFKKVARFRVPILLLGIILGLTANVLELGWFSLACPVLVVLGLILFFIPSGEKDRAPVIVRSPLDGRWLPVNSPADKVPSHGTHELGQTYAIDLVHVPDRAAEWKPLVRGSLAARPETFPSFGRPISAPADGVVVAAGGRQRDHWSRNSWPALVYLMIEGMIFRYVLSLLTLSSGRFILGNHVILDLGDGVYAVFAHLRRGSLRVAKGDRVRAGDLLGEVGNSGNSSEPHLHFHLMDGPRPLIAAGVPFAFPYRDDDAEADGEARTGVPGGRRPFVVDAGVPATNGTRS
ncbi:M23 family metallopeptidase [Actinomadura sp. 9N407]|uniref:M23 family metallopeptidase n=1 Tax=Actinomadura sp. 9N407 TaxID=3375154 RepID=UPI0037AFD980